MNRPVDDDLPSHSAPAPSIAKRVVSSRSVVLEWLSRHRADLCIGAAATGYLTWILLWQYSQFVRGEYKFHDLTLITDFFTNALYHGRPFWITELAFSHLKIHFTPTLLLIVPAFALFKSQFALIAIVAATIAAASFVVTREQLAGLEQAGVPAVYRCSLAATLFVFTAFNRYTLRCLASAHFEPMYLLPAMLALAAVRRGAKIRTLLALCLVALGVRQDVGLFLFFLLISCLFAPQSWTKICRGRVVIAAGFCVLYILIATKLVLPWFGSDVSTRMWHRWGDTWPNVFMAWCRDPGLVYKAISKSEFFAFNAEFSFLQVLPGLSWLLNQLPSTLFYTADAPDKQHLDYYNSSFLLPGMLLCLAFAQLHAVEFVQRIAKQRQRLRHVSFAAITIVFAYASIDTAFLSQRDNNDVLAVHGLRRTDVFAKSRLRQFLLCSHAHSIATDFKTIVFAPLALDKYLPPHAQQADVVVQLREDTRRLPFTVTPADLRAELIEQHRYRMVFDLDGYDVLAAPDTGMADSCQ